MLATTGPDPKVEVSRRTVVVTVPGDTRSVAVYRERTEGAFAIERITGVSSSMGTTAELTLEPGPWAVSVLDRRGVESRGARITVE